MRRRVLPAAPELFSPSPAPSLVPACLWTGFVSGTFSLSSGPLSGSFRAQPSLPVWGPGEVNSSCSTVHPPEARPRAWASPASLRAGMLREASPEATSRLRVSSFALCASRGLQECPRGSPPFAAQKLSLRGVPGTPGSCKLLCWRRTRGPAHLQRPSETSPPPGPCGCPQRLS